MRDFSAGHEALSINTATVRKQAKLDEIVEACARHDIRMICPWRDQVHAVGLERIAPRIRDSGVKLSGYCRGGFFPAADDAGLRMRIGTAAREVVLRHFTYEKHVDRFAAILKAVASHRQCLSPISK